MKIIYAKSVDKITATTYPAAAIHQRSRWVNPILICFGKIRGQMYRSFYYFIIL